MMKKTIQIFENIETLSAAFAKRISEDISGTPDGQLYSIALSGGSTPRAVFKFIAENYRFKINWSKVLVFWGDERCVPPSSDESNYKMAYDSILEHIIIPDYNIYRIKGENDPSAEAKRYAELTDYLLPHQNNIPQFDLFMLGLGEDGHTASIFPDQISLFDSDKLFEASQHPVSKQTRITATGKLINNSKEVCFLVTGESKAEKVAQIIEKKEGWELLPASFINPKEGELIWMLDEHSGRKLTDKKII
jgi:6-phosphogluconolactonase